MTRTQVAVSIAAEGTDAAVAAMHRAHAAGADLVELRLDLIPGYDLLTLLERRPCPAIVTLRPPREGGACCLPEGERLAELQTAIDLGAEMVDAEYDAVSTLHRRGGTRLIASHHEFAPGARLEDWCRLYDLGADIVKLAVAVDDATAALDVLDFQRHAPIPTVALAMGEGGVITRNLAGCYGAPFTYAAPDDAPAVAPGQVPLSHLLGMYRFREIGPETEFYGVMANPVSHSMSPAIHNAAFTHLGREAVYLPLLVHDPVAFLRRARDYCFRGFSVTIPHKQAVIAALDEVDPLAARLRSVNTVTMRDGRWRGRNTDVAGALITVAKALDGGGFAGRKVLVIGTGGLGRALAHGLAEAGAVVMVTNRTEASGREVAAEVGAEFVPLSEITALRPDILLQTTSVGMYPNVDATVVPAEMLRPGLVVYDAVYNPPETRLLREAESAGCRTVSGLGHFVNQAALQFEEWTGEPAPREIMRKALLQGLGVA